MAVRIVDATDPQALVIAGEECGHSGTAPVSSVVYGVNIDGSENRDIIGVVCPEADCGFTSFWPRTALAQDVQDKL